MEEFKYARRVVWWKSVRYYSLLLAFWSLLIWIFSKQEGAVIIPNLALVSVALTIVSQSFLIVLRQRPKLPKKQNTHTCEPVSASGPKSPNLPDDCRLDQQLSLPIRPAPSARELMAGRSFCEVFDGLSCADEVRDWINLNHRAFGFYDEWPRGQGCIGQVTRAMRECRFAEELKCDVARIDAAWSVGEIPFPLHPEPQEKSPDSH